MRRRSKRVPVREALGVTDAEAEELARMFADELAKGWIPTPHDIEDALGAIRARPVEPAVTPPDGGRRQSLE